MIMMVRMRMMITMMVIMVRMMMILMIIIKISGDSKVKEVYRVYIVNGNMCISLIYCRFKTASFTYSTTSWHVFTQAPSSTLPCRS